MKHLLSLFFILNTCFLTDLFAFTDQELIAQANKPCGCLYACCCDPLPETKIPCNKAFNAPLRYASCWGYFVTGSFLYYTADMQNFSLGILDNQIGGDFPLDGEAIHFSTSYDPGFQVSFGIDLGHDNWKTYIEYTRFHKTYNKSVSIGPDSFQEIFPFWVTTEIADRVNSTQGQWELGLDLIDWYLARRYYVGQFLTFNTFVGLRGMILDNCFTTTYTLENRPDVLESENTIRSWGIGPRAGIDTNWTLCGNFKFFANGSFGLIYQDFNKIKKKNTETDTFPLTTLEYKEDLSELCYDVHFSLGLGYDNYLVCDRWHYDLTIGYDFNRFFDQNVLRRYQSIDDNNILYGDLFLHGLTVKLAVDF